MPTSRAASTFLSQSSTNTHAAGGRPRRSAASWKIRAAGFAMPTSAETTMSSKRWCRASSPSSRPRSETSALLRTEQR